MNKVKIQLRSFKCFEDITLHLNNITFLTGANATGKSSLIQALLLADSALIEMRKEDVKIPLYDPQRALDLGKVDNLINEKGKDEVKININDTELEFRGADEVPDGFLLMRCNNIKPESGLGHISYLNAERIGPRRETELDKTIKKDCGCHGDHTASVIYNNEFTKIPSEKCYAAEMGETNIATNVGFGISYILPILVTCLLAGNKDTIIIENPEAHLHAKAQSNIGYFLGVMASSGLRIIVETHSEHIINGIRRVIACSDILKPESVTIYYFDAEGGRIQETEISIDKEGNLSRFPVDFFDQQRQDSKAIFEYLYNRQ